MLLEVCPVLASTIGVHMVFSTRLTLAIRGYFDHYTMLLLQKKTMATLGLYEQDSPGPASSTNNQLQTITQEFQSLSIDKIYAAALFNTSMVPLEGVLISG